jgi:Protein of unknown function (DUF2723)
LTPARRLAVSAAVVVFAAALICYIPTLSSAVASGDNAEAQTVPYILGIAHATGFPAYTLLGWLFSHVVNFGTVAWRLNLLTAATVAVCASGVTVLAMALESNPVASLAAGLTFAFGLIAWQQAELANVQVFAAPAVIFALALAVRFARSGDRRGFVAACACTGFGVAAHPLAVFAVPALIVSALWQRPRFDRRTLCSAVLALLAPLLLYLYFPLRSSIVAAEHLDPTAAAPLFGTGSIDWDTNRPRTLDGFLDEVLGRNEHASSALAHTLDLTAYPEAGVFALRAAGKEFSIGLLVLGTIGLLALAQRDRRALSVLVSGSVGGIAFAYIYRADDNVQGYLMGSLALVAAVAAASTRLALPAVPQRMSVAAATIALVAVAYAAWLSPRTVDGLLYPSNQSAIDEVRASVPDGAIVVTGWPDANALGYGAAVEKTLGSRIIVNDPAARYVGAYPNWAGLRPVVVDAGPRGFTLIGSVPANWLQRLPSTSRTREFFRIVPH